MRYASVCSGVEAASLAWEPLGWEPAWFAQFDPEHNYKNGPDFPSAVLAHRWPHVPNLGDMTKLQTQEVYIREKFNLLVGGTPCQDDSIAGKRKGMDGKRGIIKDDFVRILDDKQPTWFVWENVPGVLSSNGGRNFAAFIGNLKAVGYSFCWRIIDAQYCGVPQRRRRVFIVGHLGDDWRPSAAVLFEPQSMPGYFKPSKSQRQEVAKCLTARAGSSHREDSDNFVVGNGSHWDDINNPHPTLNQSHNTGGIAMSNQEIFAQRGSGLVQTYDRQSMSQYGDDGVASTINARDYKSATDLVVGCLDTEFEYQKQTMQSVNAGHVLCLPIHDKATRFQGGGTGRKNDGGGNGLLVGNDGDPMYSMLTSDKHAVCVQGSMIGRSDTAGPQGSGINYDVSFTLNTTDKHAVQTDKVVRRLTEVEGERLQGMPDHHTNIMWKNKPAPSGQRYKAIGNSMATVAMHWIGKRIDYVEKLLNGSI